MSKLNGVKSATAILMTLSMSGGAITSLVAPIVAPAAAVAQTSNFPDVEQSYWAADFISALTQRDIINGFPDGTFKPDAPVTRAQFATMLQVAFQKPEQLSAIEFADIPSGYWAAPAIREAYEVGFLSGYPGGVFQPSQNIPASKC